METKLISRTRITCCPCKLANTRYGLIKSHQKCRHGISLMSSTWHPLEEPGEIFQHWMTSWKKRSSLPRSQDAPFEHHRPHRSSASTPGFHVPTYSDGSAWMHSLTGFPEHHHWLGHCSRNNGGFRHKLLVQTPLPSNSKVQGNCKTRYKVIMGHKKGSEQVL